MPLVLQVTSTLLCAHGGKATPTMPNPRVRIVGSPAFPQTSPALVAGCGFVTPAGTPLPCVNSNWIAGALRVMSSKQPLVLQNSPTVTTPTGTPLNAIPTNTRVQGL